MTVGDVDDMFVPLAEGLMVDVSQSEAVIDSLLEQIPSMFGETRETETILGPVIQAGKNQHYIIPISNNIFTIYILMKFSITF